MHSWELITNLHAKKVLCHRAEEAKNFRCCTTDLASFPGPAQLSVACSTEKR